MIPTLTSSAVVPCARCSTRTHVTPAAPNMESVGDGDALARLTRVEMSSTCRGAGGFSAAFILFVTRLRCPGSTTPRGRDDRACRALLSGSNSRAFAFEVFDRAAGGSPNPCSLLIGFESGNSSIPAPDIRPRSELPDAVRDVREEDEVDPCSRAARLPLSSCMSCFHCDSTSLFPSRVYGFARDIVVDRDS